MHGNVNQRCGSTDGIPDLVHTGCSFRSCTEIWHKLLQSFRIPLVTPRVTLALAPVTDFEAIHSRTDSMIQDTPVAGHRKIEVEGLPDSDQLGFHKLVRGAGDCADDR